MIYNYKKYSNKNILTSSKYDVASCYHEGAMEENKMAGIDKVTRILMLYGRLYEGQKIYKKSFCTDTQIDRRTFDRDIEDIRIYLSETYSGDELVYDRDDESYHLTKLNNHQTISGMDITMLLATMNESQVLRKDEYEGIIAAILGSGEKSKQKMLNNIARRYIRNYKASGKEKAILKMQWDLQQCIAECDVIHLHIEGDRSIVCSPVGLRLFCKAFHLLAYDEAEELVAIPIERIQCFQMTRKKFRQSLCDRFDTIGESTLQKTIEKGIRNYENH